MHEDNQDKSVWPPAPSTLLENLPIVPKRLYLTGVKGLDILLGIITGLVLQGFICYGVDTGAYYLIILCYHIPKPPSLWYGVPACALALLPLPMIWSRLRSFYRTLANSLLWAGLAFGTLLLWLSYEMAADTGPTILPR